MNHKVGILVEKGFLKDCRFKTQGFKGFLKSHFKIFFRGTKNSVWVSLWNFLDMLDILAMFCCLYVWFSVACLHNEFPFLNCAFKLWTVRRPRLFLFLYWHKWCTVSIFPHTYIIIVSETILLVMGKVYDQNSIGCSLTFGYPLNTTVWLFQGFTFIFTLNSASLFEDMKIWTASHHTMQRCGFVLLPLRRRTFFKKNIMFYGMLDRKSVV